MLCHCAHDNNTGGLFELVRGIFDLSSNISRGESDNIFIKENLSVAYDELVTKLSLRIKIK